MSILNVIWTCLLGLAGTAGFFAMSYGFLRFLFGVVLPVLATETQRGVDKVLTGLVIAIFSLAYAGSTYLLYTGARTSGAHIIPGGDDDGMSYRK